MKPEAGASLWFIPDGYIPPTSTGELVSHESICVLNRHEDAVNLRITVFYEDEHPLEDIIVTVAGRRTKHIRTSELEKDGKRIRIGVPYAMEVQSDRPIIVQYSRMDTTQSANALMSVIAYPAK